MKRASVAAAVAVLLFAVPVGPLRAQDVPSINVAPGCRAAADTNIAERQTYESCMRSEREARDALVEQWNNFAAADRASCYRLTTLGTPGTYTELLTCLEMKQAARQIPDELGTVGRGTR
jgi:hypothetical protein